MPKPSIDPESAKKIVQIKEKFDFENGHLRPLSENDGGILSKCVNYQAPQQARDLGIYPYFREIADLQVSSHLLIDRNGTVTQYVPFDKKAWHAGESSFHGRSSCNDFSIGIELEGTDHEPFLPSQYETLVEVTNLLLIEYPHLNLERIVGHCDVAPGRKTDPGPFFDWERYKGALETQNISNSV